MFSLTTMVIDPAYSMDSMGTMFQSLLPTGSEFSQPVLVDVPEQKEIHVEMNVPDDGACFFYCVTLAALLPHLNNESKFSEMFSRLVGHNKEINPAEIRSILRQYDGTPHFFEKHPTLAKLANRIFRDTVVNYISENKALFEKFRTPSDISLDNHIKMMKNEKEWATQYEIFAACQILYSSIFIYQHNTQGKLFRATNHVPEHTDEAKRHHHLPLGSTFKLAYTSAGGKHAEKNHYHVFIPLNEVPYVVMDHLSKPKECISLLIKKREPVNDNIKKIAAIFCSSCSEEEKKQTLQTAMDNDYYALAIEFLRNGVLPAYTTLSIQNLINAKDTQVIAFIQSFLLALPETKEQNRFIRDLFASAVINGKEQIVALLIDKIKKMELLNKLNEAGNTPLSIAARSGHVGIVRILLSHGATDDGKALNAALSSGNSELIDLLQTGKVLVKPTDSTSGMLSALGEQKQNGSPKRKREEKSEESSSHGSKKPYGQVASEIKDVEKLKPTFENLCYYVEKKDAHAVKLLIPKSPLLRLPLKKDGKDHVLFVALQNKSTEIVEIILENTNKCYRSDMLMALIGKIKADRFTKDGYECFLPLDKEIIAVIKQKLSNDELISFIKLYIDQRVKNATQLKSEKFKDEIEGMLALVNEIKGIPPKQLDTELIMAQLASLLPSVSRLMEVDSTEEETGVETSKDKASANSAPENQGAAPKPAFMAFEIDTASASFNPIAAAETCKVDKAPTILKNIFKIDTAIMNKDGTPKRYSDAKNFLMHFLKHQKEKLTMSILSTLDDIVAGKMGNPFKKEMLNELQNAGNALDSKRMRL